MLTPCFLPDYDDPPAYSDIDDATSNSSATTGRLTRPFTEAPTTFGSMSTRVSTSASTSSKSKHKQRRSQSSKQREPGPNNDNDTRYAFLTKFDTLVLVDDSYSMAGARWAEVADALETIAPICTRYDRDGIDICFLNHSREYNNVRDAARVAEIFGSVVPRGATFTGQRLRKILTQYLNRYTAAVETVLAAHPGARTIADVVCDDDDVNDDGSGGGGGSVGGERVLPKPLNIIVLTDGEPSDDVESVIIAAARRLDRLDAPAWQVGIQFFQIGQDEHARMHLKRLDDELDALARQGKGSSGGSGASGTAAATAAGGLRDMVDTVPYAEGNKTISAEGILKVVLGAVHRRYDRNEGTNRGGSGRLHG